MPETEEETKIVENTDETVIEPEKKKGKVSSKKRKRSQSRSHDRKRSRSRRRSRSPKHSQKRSRSHHKSPKKRRSPARRSRKSHRHRSRDRHRRDRHRSSKNKKRKRNNSATDSSFSGSESNSSASNNESNIEKPEEVKVDAKVENGTKSEKTHKEVKSKSDKREKRRSASPDRRRRSPHRRRRRSRERRHSRDRHRRRSRSRKRSRSAEKEKPEAAKVESRPSKFTDVNPISKDFDQAKLEEEMKKRRERVEKWRSIKVAASATDPSEETQAPRKIWSLENDDDDEEEVEVEGESKNEKDSDEEKEKKEAEDEEKVEEVKEEDEKKKEDEEQKEDEVDPLDAYMMELNKSSKLTDKTTTSSSGAKVSRIVAVANSNQKSKSVKIKGELMEGNMDAMEYSSEEEMESLDSAFSKFQNKQQPRKLEVAVDHSKIVYEPFRKCFYLEVPALAKLTAAEVEVIRNEMEGVSIRGKNCPKPILSWVQAGVSSIVFGILKKSGYQKPTPIQAQAIPAIMAGNDLIGIAKTGSGKTLAFVLPMLRHIRGQRPLEEGEGPIAIIMTPTRELALQINKECKKFTRSLKLKSVCVYGGTGISEQIAELKRGAEIIVCTPGRMIDMMFANSGRVTNMRRCTYLVMDEADRMFDMGFAPQAKSVIMSCRPDRQLVMFSATFPRQMEALARQILNKPVQVQIGGRSIVCSDVKQEVIVLTEEQKYLKLLELLGKASGSTLVFVDKQERADHLLKDLMGNSYACMALHGGIDQYDRDSIINDFKSGVNRLLIATSVAARGLDVRNLNLVVNFNCPNHYEDYVHRCGRTGRAGQKGEAYTFITPDQSRYAGEIIKALELSGAEVPKQLEKLWLDYKNEQQAQGKKVKQNSGFSGRGFKFDETEATLALERKQIQKAALGLQDSDEDEPAQDIDDQIESMFNSKKTVKDISKPFMIRPGISVMSGAANQAKLDMAKMMASRINMQRNLNSQPNVMQRAATALMQGRSYQAPRISGKTIAEQIAERINNKLNYIPQEKTEEELNEEERLNGQITKHYEEELEINDFPQTCRWKVTSKDTLSQISEYSEAGITIRGQFFAVGKQPGEDERKLYLAIEASSELSVQKAKSEITRLIKEELVRLQNSYQPINKGRYKVL